MRPISSSLLAVVIVMVGQAGWATPAAADNAQTRAVRNEIQQELDKVMQMYRQHASGHQIAAALYEADATATGEGEKGLYRGRNSFESILSEHAAEERTCTMTVVDPIRYSGDLASAYVSAHCPDTRPVAHEDARMLMVFHKGATGWRVIQEMYIWGPM